MLEQAPAAQSPVDRQQCRQHNPGHHGWGAYQSPRTARTACAPRSARCRTPTAGGLAPVWQWQWQGTITFGSCLARAGQPMLAVELSLSAPGHYHEGSAGPTHAAATPDRARGHQAWTGAARAAQAAAASKVAAPAAVLGPLVRRLGPLPSQARQLSHCMQTMRTGELPTSLQQADRLKVACTARRAQGAARLLTKRWGCGALGWGHACRGLAHHHQPQG